MLRGSFLAFKAVNDDQLLKFTKSGKFVMQISRSNAATGNADAKNLHEPADAVIFRRTNELFVADGYGNHRVVVFDADTGAFKRMWGAFGNRPEDRDQCPPLDPSPVPDNGTPGPEQFSIVHAVRVSDDGFVYVCDRENKRVQVFTTDGKFVNQVFVGRSTPNLSRTTGGLAFSSDPQQTYLYVTGSRIVVLNRKTLKVLSSDAGAGGHHIAADSKGNLYSASLGRGVQKLVFKGVSQGSVVNHPDRLEPYSLMVSLHLSPYAANELGLCNYNQDTRYAHVYSGFQP